MGKCLKSWPQSVQAFAARTTLQALHMLRSAVHALRSYIIHPELQSHLRSVASQGSANGQVVCPQMYLRHVPGISPVLCCNLNESSVSSVRLSIDVSIGFVCDRGAASPW